MDDLTFTLNDSGAGRGCQVEAFSTSRLWFVDDDFDNDNSHDGSGCEVDAISA